MITLFLYDPDFLLTHSNNEDGLKREQTLTAGYDEFAFDAFQ